MSDIPVFLLHGLGSHPITLHPLERHLNKNGWMRTKAISYNPDRENIEEAVDEVDRILSFYADKQSEQIILIGQSMGGVISNKMHTRGWNIKKAIYIGSPLHGARMVNVVENWFGNTLASLMRSPAWKPLSKGEKVKEPPHDYHTISMGWYNSSWDSRVFKDETMLHPLKHTHLAGEDHCLVFMKKRLFDVVTLSLPEVGDGLGSTLAPPSASDQTPPVLLPSLSADVGIALPSPPNAPAHRHLRSDGNPETSSGGQSVLRTDDMGHT